MRVHTDGKQCYICLIPHLSIYSTFFSLFFFFQLLDRPRSQLVGSLNPLILRCCSHHKKYSLPLKNLYRPMKTQLTYQTRLTPHEAHLRLPYYFFFLSFFLLFLCDTMKFVLSKYRPILSAEEFKIVGNMNVVNTLNRCQFCATDPLQPSGSSLFYFNI